MLELSSYQDMAKNFSQGVLIPHPRFRSIHDINIPPSLVDNWLFVFLSWYFGSNVMVVFFAKSLFFCDLFAAYMQVFFGTNISLCGAVGLDWQFFVLVILESVVACVPLPRSFSRVFPVLPPVSRKTSISLSSQTQPHNPPAPSLAGPALDRPMAG